MLFSKRNENGPDLSWYTPSARIYEAYLFISFGTTEYAVS